VEKLGDPDLVILPGTKSTMADVLFLHQSGLSARIIQMAEAGTPVFGMCGGYQMLGRKIYDPVQAESEITEADGLGLLDMETVFGPHKITAQVSARVDADSGLLMGMQGLDITGYEIHMGRCSKQPPHSVFTVTPPGNTPAGYRDGGINQTGRVFGSYIHGLFNNIEFTRRLVENLCSLRNLPLAEADALNREKAYDDIASVFRQSLDMAKIYEIIFGGSHGRRTV
jgi:adenosylcobyric acid synthase